MIQAALSYIYTPFATTLSEYRFKSEVKKFVVLSLKITAAICLFAIVMLVFSWFFGEFALFLLFGEEIVSHVSFLVPILIAITALAIFGFLCMLAIVLRNMVSLVIGSAAGFISTAFVTMPMINQFGVNGTSYSLTVSVFISNAFLVVGIIYTLYSDSKKVHAVKERN